MLVLFLFSTSYANNVDAAHTQQVVQSCHDAAEAANPGLSVSVTENGQTIAGPTADLATVYAALAGVDGSLPFDVTSNAAGTAALAADQICLDARVDTVGMVRLHQARADLRHDTHIYEDSTGTYNTINFDPASQDPWLTVHPDSSSSCITVSFKALPLQGGDFALSGNIAPLGEDDCDEKTKYVIKCNGSCGQGICELQPGDPKQCLCSISGEDCGGESEYTVEATCPADGGSDDSDDNLLGD